MATGPMVPASAPLGKPRSTGLTIFLFVITFGIWGYVWWYLVHEDMKRHTGDGIGGIFALLIAILASPVMAFLTPDEVGKMYRKAGIEPPVSALTGLWYFPGMLLVIPAIVWFVKTNGAINDYWRGLGVEG